MFRTLTVKTLLWTALIALATTSVIPLAVRAFDTWTLLGTATVMAQVADASRDAFTVLTESRADRNSIPRAWADATPMSAEAATYVRSKQNREMEALRSLDARMNDLTLTGGAQLAADVHQSLDAMTRLQAEFWRGLETPQTARRAALGADYTRENDLMQHRLEDVSRTLLTAVRGLDGVVDRMMSLRQLAWQARESAGEASVLISRGLTAGTLPADTYRTFDRAIGGNLAAWRAMEELTAGTAMPHDLEEAFRKAKQTNFDPGFETLREKTLATLISGNRPDMSAVDWSMAVVPKMDTVLGIAEAATRAAHDRAESLHAEAALGLAWDLTFLLLVIVGSGAGMLVVSRRVITPLHLIRDAMARLAAGDLTTAARFRPRADEIGALAAALRVFQEQAAAKAALEASEQDHQRHETARRARIDTEIRTFETTVSASLHVLGDAAARMSAASAAMGEVSRRTHQGVGGVAADVEETSAGINGIAAAAEELSGSITEISRHVAIATGITGRAVEDTHRTDGVVRGLAESANRIGTVVQLIGEIAGRTNLLALNATIEAARAGDAGKGFAVVASEVKSLANQTAKATDDIARQIADVQGVTQETVQGIQRIAATIEEMNEVAQAIAANIAHQGDATREIARTVEEVARRTRQMAETTAQVSEDAGVTDRTAGDVASASAAVAEGAEMLRGRVDTFLTEMRAA